MNSKFSMWQYIIILLLHYPAGLFSLLHSYNNNHSCLEDERQLLLQLKQQLLPHTSNYYKTKYWSRSRPDCCLWDGVTCHHSTRHVIALDLGNSSLTGNIQSNSSLFRLTHLRHLNLSVNYFNTSQFPSKFGQLHSLTHLDLSYSSFTGRIPPEFYHLSNLASLDLSGNDGLLCDIKSLFGNMTKIRRVSLAGINVASEIPMNMSSLLTHLDLSSTGLQGQLPVTIFENPNLQVLNLYSNGGLKGSFPPYLNRSNVHSLKVFDLSDTGMSGTLPASIDSMNNLNHLKLALCELSGPIPESIGNLTQIIDIFLYNNKLSGQVPSSISNLRHLSVLDVSDNHLQGQLPDVFSDLQKLIDLDFHRNSLVGPIPPSLTNMSQLERLFISSNALTGPFPSNAGRGLQNLVNMDLSHNLIQGMMPSWMLNLPSLVSLHLSFNRLSGHTGQFNNHLLRSAYLSSNQLNVELESFYNLTELRYLQLSHNHLLTNRAHVKNVTFPRLSYLEVYSCNAEEFPNSLRNMPDIFHLDLSDNKISGPIPNWFTSMPWDDMYYLNISKNFLTDAEYFPWQQLQYLDIHANSLQGTFPSSICNMTHLYLLNLFNNKLRGEIPECIGNSSMALSILDLRKNEFHGNIPKRIGSAVSNLGLNGNHLEGPLPRSLANCINLEVLDLGNNMIRDTFPWWLQTLPNLKILILKSNNFYGSITDSHSFSNNSFNILQIIDLSCNNFTGLLPGKLFASLQAIKSQSQDPPKGSLYMNSYYLNIRDRYYEYSVTLSVKGQEVFLPRVLSILTTIDLSSNNFEGNIPESIAFLYSLRLLNLSHNSINGSIPSSLERMTNLEHLDLSNNQLTGGIPQTFTNLTFLAVLNVSHNHLVGPIPQSNQFSTFSNDSFAGNSGLCGAPLMKTCGDDITPGVSKEEDDDDYGLMMGFSWQAVVMGYGCGILIGFILGNMMISTGKPKWVARFVNEGVAICRNRRKKGGRMAAQRRR